jgi:hypothetical protein
MGVDATGRWGEGGCVIPGEICQPAIELMPPRGGMMGWQKSAEGTVVTAHGDEGPNEKEGWVPSFDGRRRRRQDG